MKNKIILMFSIFITCLFCNQTNSFGAIAGRPDTVIVASNGYFDGSVSIKRDLTITNNLVVKGNQISLGSLLGSSIIGNYYAAIGTGSGIGAIWTNSVAFGIYAGMRAEGRGQFYMDSYDSTPDVNNRGYENAIWGDNGNLNLGRIGPYASGKVNHLRGTWEVDNILELPASSITLDTDLFDNNLDGTIINVQLLADEVDELASSAGCTNTLRVNNLGGYISNNLVIYIPSNSEDIADWQWTTNYGNASVTITNYTGTGHRYQSFPSSLYEVLIPSYINGMPVTDLGNSTTRFIDNTKSYRRVVIPDTVININARALWMATNIYEVTFGNSVAIIGNESFYSNRISSISLPDTAGNIGSSAFRYCRYLTSVNLNNVYAINDNAFNECIISSLTGGSNLNIVGESAFNHGLTLESITLLGTTPQSPYFTLYLNAFATNTNLKYVYFMGDAPYSIVGNPYNGSTSLTNYYIYGKLGWPEVPNNYQGRPTALWKPYIYGSGTYVTDLNYNSITNPPAPSPPLAILPGTNILVITNGNDRTINTTNVISRIDINGVQHSPSATGVATVTLNKGENLPLRIYPVGGIVTLNKNTNHYSVVLYDANITSIDIDNPTTQTNGALYKLDLTWLPQGGITFSWGAGTHWANIPTPSTLGKTTWSYVIEILPGSTSPSSSTTTNVYW